MIRQALEDSEIERCFRVMSELRPHLQEAEFLNTVRQMQTEGFRLVYIEEDGEVVATAGYRIYTNLFLGKHLYVDDLVTSGNARSRGHGETLLNWLREMAIAEQCNYLHLDSGTQRDQAHKFYFRQGMTIKSFHFVEDLR